MREAQIKNQELGIKKVCFAIANVIFLILNSCCFQEKIIILSHWNMTKQRLISILLVFFALCSKAQLRLVDINDNCPVQAASVFVEGGKCVGASGNDGSLPLPKGYNGTVTVQHINYGSKEFLADTVSDGTVRLTPYIYKIPEVTAKFERPDYMVVTAYERSYMIIDSIPSSFCDAVYDYYVPLRHGRVRRKMRSMRDLHKVRSQENSQSEFYSSPTMIKLKKKTLLDKFRDKGYLADSTANGTIDRGRSGDVKGIRRDLAGKTLTVYIDSVFANRKRRTVSFFGIKIRFENYKKGETYDTSSNSSPTLKNLVNMYEYLDMYMRPGKKFKMARCETFEDLYVIGVSYATKEEMKAAMKDDGLEPLAVPPYVPPLSAPLAEAVSRME